MKESYKKYLTPEIMKDILKMNSAEELVKYAAEKDITIDVAEAEELMKLLARADDASRVPLDDEELDKIAGGVQCDRCPRSR